ncbi:uncharacterized protein LOC122503397 isoform X2 [Leptopilina heterotoma]|uniref:uncharacterized protein LOC122503397 isoform X2 n=1 Tax=Leptopilina heterotoma TaxID=63436 RepID=UPI001CAA119C|nr:uncharacterized protein LOC122503397 isoform X2 [Leptopilina heterotoma]
MVSFKHFLLLSIFTISIVNGLWPFTKKNKNNGKRKESVSIEESTGSIADYTKDCTPMVPPIVTKYIEEVENRGMEYEGLYRKSATITEIENLENVIDSDINADISTFSTPAITSALKNFLRNNLLESVINKETMDQLLNNFENKEELKTIIYNLPQPKQDTLAYLIIHLQKVEVKQMVNENKRMTYHNLAVIFRPSIIHKEGIDTLPNWKQQNAAQITIIEGLLNIPTIFWNNLLYNIATGSIADYAKHYSPMVPPILVKYIKEIENRGMRSVGLYLFDAEDMEIKKLQNRCKDLHADISKYSILTIASALKSFLGDQLTDKTINEETRNQIIYALRMKNDEEIKKIIFQLPKPNRETLAYLIIHLQKVIKERKSGMSHMKIASVFSNILINKYHTSREIVYTFFKYSSSFWLSSLENDDNSGADDDDDDNDDDNDVNDSSSGVDDDNDEIWQEEGSSGGVPSSNDMSSATRKLKDNANDDLTMVPSILRKYIEEIEEREMEYRTLYLERGELKEITLLYNICNNDLNADISAFSISAITSAVKLFLREYFKKKLIDEEMRDNFLSAFEIQDKRKSETKMKIIISRLPQLNCATLAYMIIHLKKVLNQETNRLTHSMYATIFAPIFINHKVHLYENTINTNSMIIEHLKFKEKLKTIIQIFLSFPISYWEIMINNPYSTRKKYHKKISGFERD